MGPATSMKTRPAWSGLRPRPATGGSNSVNPVPPAVQETLMLPAPSALGHRLGAHHLHAKVMDRVNTLLEHSQGTRPSILRAARVSAGILRAQ
jgi:hypothetical protein